MVLSDISVRRPVIAAVLSLLIVAFGLVAFDRLPLREYPDIDPPVVTIETEYPGAAAEVVETRITEVIEERIAGIEASPSSSPPARTASRRSPSSSAVAAMSMPPPTISVTASPASSTTCRPTPTRRTSARRTPATT